MAGAGAAIAAGASVRAGASRPVSDATPGGPAGVTAAAAVSTVAAAAAGAATGFEPAGAGAVETAGAAAVRSGVGRGADAKGSVVKAEVVGVGIADAAATGAAGTIEACDAGDAATVVAALDAAVACATEAGGLWTPLVGMSDGADEGGDAAAGARPVCAGGEAAAPVGEFTGGEIAIVGTVTAGSGTTATAIGAADATTGGVASAVSSLPRSSLSCSSRPVEVAAAPAGGLTEVGMTGVTSVDAAGAPELERVGDTAADLAAAPGLTGEVAAERNREVPAGGAVATRPGAPVGSEAEGEEAVAPVEPVGGAAAVSAERRASKPPVGAIAPPPAGAEGAAAGGAADVARISGMGTGGDKRKQGPRVLRRGVRPAVATDGPDGESLAPARIVSSHTPRLSRRKDAFCRAAQRPGGGNRRAPRPRRPRIGRCGGEWRPSCAAGNAMAPASTTKPKRCKGSAPSVRAPGAAGAAGLRDELAGREG